MQVCTGSEGLQPRLLGPMIVLAAALIGGGAVAGPPEEGDCPAVVGVPTLDPGKGPIDAPPVLLREGMQIEADQLLLLRRLLPPLIWQHREVFFFEGMRMVIGGCHRRYVGFNPYRR